MMHHDNINVEVCGKFGVTPFMSKEGSAGYDIHLPKDAGAVVMPYNSRRLIDTGVIFGLPERCWILLTLRSSSRKKAVRISNTIGVIDPSYCGPNDHLMVDLTRTSKAKRFLGRVPRAVVSDRDVMTAQLNAWGVSRNDLLTSVKCPYTKEYHWYVEDADDFVVFAPGEKFCQVIFVPFPQVNLVEKTLETWADSEDRGGFGSTGRY